MSGFSNYNARKRAFSALGVVGKTARQQMTESFDRRDSGSRSGQMTSQLNYGLSPLSDDEVRMLPVAHQYSS